MVRRLVLIAVVSFALLGVGVASAATGDLTFKDCFAKFATSNPTCAAVPGGLEGGRDVAISPDGKLLYVADGNDTVVGFTRSLNDGSLAYAGCIESGGSGSCAHTPNNTMLVPNSLAFSPDGNTLYVATETSDTVVRLGVGAGGALSFLSCVESNDALHDWGCAAEAAGMDTIFRVVASPDGNSVYASSEPATLNHFSAALAPLSCYAEVTVVGCPTQAEPLQAPRGLGISPNGAHLYVTSVGRDAIRWFKREANGTLTGGGCVADDDDATAFSDNCTEESGVDYNFLKDIAFSPDGTDAYVSDETSLGVIYHFTRNTTSGALTRQECFADDLNVDAPGCEELDDATGSGLHDATDAVVSPDSASLYVLGRSDALNTFTLASPSGTMTFIRCLRSNAVQGCAGLGTAGVLDAPNAVAISPDGHDLYVANQSGTPALLHFERVAPGTRPGEEEPGPEEPGPEEPGPEEPAPGSGGSGGSSSGSGGSGSGSGGGGGGGSTQEPPTKCSGLKATRVGTAKAETIKGTGKRDVIAAGGGNDKVEGLAGNDVVCGEGGNDQLGGGPGGDTLLGGPGKDIVKGGGGADQMIGGPGKDTLLGGPGRDSARQ
jgi:DNA-binding beta-propeller fold protein YncE